jgi:tRNA G18 (ribose-2'-O)-methylase SpoU
MISQKREAEHKDVSILLHNIRSTYNVGSIFRTADAVGVSKIYLSGYTPAPVDRFGRNRQDISRASLGAEKTVAWESVDSPFELIKELKKEKVKIIGLEQDKKSIDYKEINLDQRSLIILGEEVSGIEKKLIDLCDQIVEIPMFGKKESLNVSVATGVLLYRIMKI